MCKADTKLNNLRESGHHAAVFIGAYVHANSSACFHMLAMFYAMCHEVHRKVRAGCQPVMPCKTGLVETGSIAWLLQDKDLVSGLLQMPFSKFRVTQLHLLAQAAGSVPHIVKYIV